MVHHFLSMTGLATLRSEPYFFLRSETNRNKFNFIVSKDYGKRLLGDLHGAMWMRPMPVVREGIDIAPLM